VKIAAELRAFAKFAAALEGRRHGINASLIEELWAFFSNFSFDDLCLVWKLSTPLLSIWASR
jgi:hypothetical protein